MMKIIKTHLWIFIDKELKKKLINLAIKDERTLSSLVIKILKDYINNK